MQIRAACGTGKRLFVWRREMYRSKMSETSKQGDKPTVSAILPDGNIVEMVYDREQHRTRFVVGRDDQWTFQDSVELHGTRLVPYSPDNNLLEHGVVLFPSEPAPYESQAVLVAEIQAFIHRYVDDNLGGLAHDRGQYRDAVKWIGQALEMRRIVYAGQDHPELAQSILNYAIAVGQLPGHEFEALAKRRDAIEMYERLTIFYMDWAYRNARVLARPDKDWLRPVRQSTSSIDEQEEVDASGFALVDHERSGGSLSANIVEIGVVYDGRVTGIRPFGAFVEIAPGCSGLCHISELDDNFIPKIEDVVKVGDTMRVRVLNIDGRRIVLSRRAAATSSRE